MLKLPFKILFFLPILIPPILLRGYQTSNPSSINEGATAQIELANFSIGTFNYIKILSGGAYKSDGQIVGSFLDTNTSQVTTAGNTFQFVPYDQDFFGDLYVDFNVSTSSGITTYDGNDALLITVISTNDDPVLKSGTTNATNANSNVSYTVQEGNTFVALATASDVDGGTPSIIINGGDDAAFFVFENGKLQFNAAPNFEFPGDVGSNNEYEVSITAIDPQGDTNKTQAITVTVSDTNDLPVINNGNNPLIFTIDEDANSTDWENTVGNFSLSASDEDTICFSVFQ